MARVNLHDLPTRFYSRTPEGALIFQAGKIGPLGPGAGCDGPMTKIARDFVLETEGLRPVTLLDFKAGIEDVSRGVVTSLDWIVGVIDPSYAGVRAGAVLQQLLEEMHAGRMPATRHLQSAEMVKVTEDAYRSARTKGAVFVLNKLPAAENAHSFWEMLREANINPVASINDEQALRRQWMEGLPLISASARSEATRIVRALEEGRGRFARSQSFAPVQHAAS
jgi:CO dehydrogenase nickel-insertion accessory protein CooC1